MSRLPDEFHQDRALRDAARDVLVADIEHAKATFSSKGLAGLITGRIGSGARDVVDVAKGHAADRQGWLAGLIALIVLWLAREPLKEIFGFDTASDPATSEEADGASDDLDEERDDSEEPPSGEADERAADPVETADDWQSAAPDNEFDPLATGETA